MKLRVIALGTLLVVLAGTAANARTNVPSVQTNASVTCCDPPPVCGARKCPPVEK
jgi:hypothetical protein